MLAIGRPVHLAFSTLAALLLATGCRPVQITLECPPGELAYDIEHDIAVTFDSNGKSDFDLTWDWSSSWGVVLEYLALDDIEVTEPDDDGRIVFEGVTGGDHILTVLSPLCDDNDSPDYASGGAACKGNLNVTAVAIDAGVLAVDRASDVCQLDFENLTLP